MMDSGNIILDVSGEKRAGMTVEDLLEQFAVCAGKRLDNDRILFSQAEWWLVNDRILFSQAE